MLIPVLAGLGALSLLSNPPRRKRRNPKKAKRRGGRPRGWKAASTRGERRPPGRWKPTGRRAKWRDLAGRFHTQYSTSWVQRQRNERHGMRVVDEVLRESHGRQHLRPGRGRNRRNPKKAKRESRLAAFLRERDFSRKLGLSQAEIDADMGNIARERRRRQAAKRRNPSKISRASLTEAEEMVGNRAMLADKRQHAWVMSKKNAQTVSRQLKHGFHRVESTHRGARGEKLYLVTDGHWFVADTHPHATGGRYAHTSGAARRRMRAAAKARR